MTELEFKLELATELESELDTELDTELELMLLVICDELIALELKLLCTTAKLLELIEELLLGSLMVLELFSLELFRLELDGTLDKTLEEELALELSATELVLEIAGVLELVIAVELELIAGGLVLSSSPPLLPHATRLSAVTSKKAALFTDKALLEKSVLFIVKTPVGGPFKNDYF